MNAEAEKLSEVELALAELRAERGKFAVMMNYLTSPLFAAEMMEKHAAAVRQGMNPLVNRKLGAELVCCTESKFDAGAAWLVENGLMKRHECGGTPLFERAEIVALIVDGKWPKVENKRAA